MALVRLTEARCEEIGKRILDIAGIRPLTHTLIEEIGLDLAESYPDQFYWFTWSNDNQIERIRAWLVEESSRRGEYEQGMSRISG